MPRMLCARVVTPCGRRRAVTRDVFGEMPGPGCPAGAPPCRHLSPVPAAACRRGDNGGCRSAPSKALFAARLRDSCHALVLGTFRCGDAAGARLRHDPISRCRRACDRRHHVPVGACRAMTNWNWWTGVAVFTVSLAGCSSGTVLCAPCGYGLAVETAGFVLADDGATGYRVCADGRCWSTSRVADIEQQTGLTGALVGVTRAGGTIHGLRIGVLRGSQILRESRPADITVPPAKDGGDGRSCSCPANWRLRYDPRTGRLALDGRTDGHR
jgi:hypothetical protein